MTGLGIKMNPVRLLVTLFLLLASNEIVASKPLKQPEQWQNDLVNWLIHKPNGYFSDKVLWTKTDEMGYNMHAADFIPKNETIMVIPQAAIIHSDDTNEECVTIHKMIKEYEKGSSSDYYPYIRYLFDGHEGGTSTGLLPTTWSAPAKLLLRTMLGSELHPQRFEKRQLSVLQDCEEYLDDYITDPSDMERETEKRWQNAYIFWLSRSWTDKMCPILDMINHRNGKWLNVESTTAHAGEDIRVYAFRDIEKGEQLWNSYNECLDTDCDGGEIKYTYVTQHILEDYGFVEDYPRRFIFPVNQEGTLLEGGHLVYDEDENHLIVEIDEDPDDPSKHVLDWHYDTPTDKQLNWITHQLERLESLEDTVKKGLAELTSDHEKNTIETYYNAYKEAFQLALKHKDDDVSTKTTILRDDDDDVYYDDEEGDEL